MSFENKEITKEKLPHKSSYENYFFYYVTCYYVFKYQNSKQYKPNASVLKISLSINNPKPFQTLYWQAKYLKFNTSSCDKCFNDLVSTWNSLNTLMTSTNF